MCLERASVDVKGMMKTTQMNNDEKVKSGTGKEKRPWQRMHQQRMMSKVRDARDGVDRECS
jgi:hypothetical protein